MKEFLTVISIIFIIGAIVPPLSITVEVGTIYAILGSGTGIMAAILSLKERR